MLNIVDCEKSSAQKIQKERSIRKQKLFRASLLKSLPDKKCLDMYFKKQKNQSQLYQLYHFQHILTKDYERILQNPFYYLKDQRNFRMFKMFLKKIGYSTQKQTKQISSETTLTQAMNIRLFDFQFTNKAQINYKQPWKYIKQNVGIVPKTQNKQIQIRKSSILQNKNSLFSKILEKDKASQRLSLQKIKPAQQKKHKRLSQKQMLSLKRQMLSSRLQKKLASSQKHLKSLKQIQQQMRLTKYHKNLHLHQSSLSNRLNSSTQFHRLLQINHEIRKKCLNNPQTFKNISPNKLKQSKQLQNYLSKRIGIQQQEN